MNTEWEYAFCQVCQQLQNTSRIDEEIVDPLPRIPILIPTCRPLLIYSVLLPPPSFTIPHLHHNNMASESRNRVEPGSVNIPVGKFPPSSTSTSVNAEQVATEIIDRLNTALAQKDYQSISSLFLDDGFWRDHLCLSWDFRTVKGSQNVAKFLADHPQPLKLALDHSSPFRAPHVGPIDAFGDVTGIEFFVSVTTAVGTGWGVVRLAETDGWKIFTCFTSLRELTGAEEKVNDRRPVGVQHGEQTGRKNWQDRRAADINFEDKEPAVVIIG